MRCNMMNFPSKLLPYALLIALSSFVANLSAQGTRSDYERADNLRKLTANKVSKTRIEPHWIVARDQLWYRNILSSGAHEFVLVDLAAGERSIAFDHDRVAKALSKATSKQVPATELPVKRIESVNDEVYFEALQSWWKWDSKSNELHKSKRPAQPKNKPTPDKKASPPKTEEPPRQWDASIKDFNVVLRQKKTGEEIKLTTDGTKDDSYQTRMKWSPDGKKLVVQRTRRGDERTVYLIESAPKDQLQPKLHSHKYLKPGDPIALSTYCLFDIAKRKRIEIDKTLFPNPWSLRDLRWEADSRRFTFLYNQRGHQVLRVVAVDAETGEAGVLIDEQSETFVDYAYKQFNTYLPKTNELVWMSERDGWNHLYLFDLRTGNLKNQITKGDWVVRKVEKVDVEKRQIWFRAGGVYPEQDPYYEHYCRVDFDGANLVILTRGNGTHAIQTSPDRKYFIDTYSRVDAPPVHELRRTTDGSLVCDLERADWSQLLATGWTTPERFVAKGRDNKTDIHGIIWRPTNFDAKKKYPVIEKIYAGPHGFFVPKKFSSYFKTQSLAELGFIVVQMDGMGTNWRDRAFHDVCWKNLGDSGFPDRIEWIKAAAKKYPQMVVDRVGIFGGSAGGQSSTRAMLAHGDFYKVAVSDCGCHDNRMDKIWWNEAWMGWPMGPHYKEQSNVTNAHKLSGKLLLTVGELDRNVDPASTMQVIDALIKADKDFDMLVVPGGGHGVGESPYGLRRRRDYFVRHLLGVEPRATP